MAEDLAAAASVTPESFVVSAADHRERGRIRGQRLAAGIASSVAAYADYFAFLGIAEADAGSAADASFEALRIWDADAAEEVEAVAAGAGISVTALMGVIARTEIMTQAAEAPTECSTVSLTRPGGSLASQNWDWAADYSELWHFNEVGAVPGQFAHAGFAEYGMLGKIGLNEAGVGVLLNILKHDGDGPGGVPIHMILERVLSRAGSLAEALALIHSAPTCSSSIITVITADEAVQVEIANAQKRERRAGDAGAGAGAGAGLMAHTNHFLHPDLLDGALELNPTSTSQARYALLEQRVAARGTAGGAGSGATASSANSADSGIASANDAGVAVDSADEADSAATSADLLALLTTGPDEAPISCSAAPGAPYGQRSATLVTVQVDPVAKTIDLAPGSPADGLAGNRRFQL